MLLWQEVLFNPGSIAANSCHRSGQPSGEGRLDKQGSGAEKYHKKEKFYAYPDVANQTEKVDNSEVHNLPAIGDHVVVASEAIAIDRTRYVIDPM
ncbi:MAG: hypothetical protein CMJ81_19040 [Planctomycetaceae bacterium]|jgi:hypothetical protein|nr:hypothetical protein [Planctomycetaceae bacterium]MBP62664.1 hypothetical protein [Planctomycetaceae bacterium]